MLLGLALAILLALALQLNALRLRRPLQFDVAGDGAIRLRCWTVLEVRPVLASCAAPPLALSAPLMDRRQTLRFVGEPLLLARAAGVPMLRSDRGQTGLRDPILVPPDLLDALGLGRPPHGPEQPRAMRAAPVVPARAPASATLH